MFKITILTLVLFLQVIPSILINQVSGDLEWQMWHVSLLTIIATQALYINRYLPIPTTLDFRAIYTKVVSVIILGISLWFLLDYVFVTNKDLKQESQVLYNLSE